MLHQSPDFAAAAESEFRPGAARHELRGEAERSLRMARVLATGGFPEEALPLIAKAIGMGAAARLAAFGELAAGATMATPAQIRDLVDRGALLRRRRPRCRRCGHLPEDVASATLYRSWIVRRSPSPGSTTENGRRPH